MQEFLLNHYLEIINGLMLLITGSFWIDAKKKRAELKQLNANAKGSEADAIKKMFDIYQDNIKDLDEWCKKRVTEVENFYKERIEFIKVTIRKELRAEMEKKFNERFAELEEEIKRLRSNLELWKNKYRKLKEAFDKYREKHGDQ